MAAKSNGSVERRSAAPSVLELVQLSPRPVVPPGGEELFRQIAILTGMAEGEEVLVVPCGPGVSLEYFVRERGVQGSGVDPDSEMVERTEDLARREGLLQRIQAQQGWADDLPYRDGVFDIAVGEMGLTRGVEPVAAVQELVRVTRPGGRLVLVQPVWKAVVEPERREVLSEHLGARPLMLQEWKRLLREAGVEELHSETWSHAGTTLRPYVAKPFPDFAEIFTLREKLAILRRAWGRWGWRGVHAALAREMEVHRVLTRERILGLDIVIGRKVRERAQDGEADGAGSDGDAREAERDRSNGGPPGAEDRSLEGLPLFTSGGEGR